MPSNQIPIIWYEGVLGLEKRSRYADATLLNEAFDGTADYELLHSTSAADIMSLVHCSGMADCPADATEAVVVIHGEHLIGQVNQIQSDLNRFQRAIVVVFCDDGAYFPTQSLVQTNRKIWQQMPIPGKHWFASRFLICGYPHDTQMHLANYDATLVDRPLDWFFSGQITHVRRTVCASVLRDMPNGRLIETKGFWQGLERAEYFRTMASAKIVPCPSGPVTPDTIRMAEALEAGCLPIIDATCPRPGFPDGFWDYVLKCTPPFPIVRDWKTLPEVMRQELAKWPANRDTAMAWWKDYKKAMHGWFSQDMTALRRGA